MGVKSRQPGSADVLSSADTMVVSEECEAREEEQSIIDSITLEDLLTEKMELSRLQSLIPSVSIKDNVTQLDIILEAIRYISSLTTRLGEEEVTGTLTSE